MPSYKAGRMAEDIRRIGAVAAERLGVEQPKDIECAEEK